MTPVKWLAAGLLLSGGNGCTDALPESTAEDLASARAKDLSVMEDGALRLDLASPLDLHPATIVSFAQAFASHPPTTPYGLYLPYFAIFDYDRDGNLDLVDTGLYVYRGQGDGTFAEPFLIGKTMGGGTGGEANTRVSAGDFDGDGLPDVAATDYMGNAVAVSFNESHGKFSAIMEMPAGDTPWGLVAADFDGNGLADLAVTNQSGRQQEMTVSVILSEGDRSFATRIAYDVTSNPLDLFSGDMNGDGTPDLVAYSEPVQGGYALSVLLGQGKGSFGPSVMTAVAARSGLAVADFNRDARSDVLELLGAGNMCPVPHTAILLPSIGGGSFGPPVVIETGPHYESVTAADFNGDGALDFVTCGYGNEFSFIPGDGHGGFGPPVPMGKVIGCGPLLSADFNNDGWPDILVTASAPIDPTNDTFLVYLNTSH